MKGEEYNNEYKRIFAMMKDEPDRTKRWDIMCDETPNDQSGVWMCQKLEDAAMNFLQGGILPPDLPPLVPEEIADKIAPPIDETDKEWEEKKRIAHQQLDVMNEEEMNTAELEY